MLPEVESSRTSSRTHFEVLGLEASSPRKLPCPRLENSTIFELLKFCWKTPETSRKICKDLLCFPHVEIAWKKIFEDLFRLKKSFKTFFWDRLKKNFEDLFSENTGVCVFGPWPWPREGLSLASKFFCVLGLSLEPCVLDSTSACYIAFAWGLVNIVTVSLS